MGMEIVAKGSHKAIITIPDDKRALSLAQWLSPNFLMHLADAVVLLLVFVFQGTVINYYMISHFKRSIVHYFWFLADFLVLVLFVWALTVAYQRLKIMREGTGSFSLSPRKVTAAFDANVVGVLPLSWITWLIYSVILVAKVAVLFKTEIPNSLEPSDTFGPQLLKVAIGSTAVIFMLFVEAHHDTSTKTTMDNYISTLVTSTAFEVLDSVTFLGLLFVDESRIVFTFDMENCIVALSAINLLLPTIAIYKLSVSDFGHKEWPLGATVLYKLVHLLVINLPYLGIRIHLWTSYDKDVSMFIVKNVYGIFVTLRTVYPELRTGYRRFRKVKKRRTVYTDQDLTFELAHVRPPGPPPSGPQDSGKDMGVRGAGDTGAEEEKAPSPGTMEPQQHEASSLGANTTSGEQPETRNLLQKVIVEQ